jgi:hypothetical protein
MSQAPAPKKKPTVRWRDMSSTIFASKKPKRNAAKDDNSEVEDDFADESDANEDGEELDNEEPEDEDDGSNGSKTVDDFQG